MKQTIKTVHILDAPAEKVWATISKATSVDTWLPVVTTCQLEGKGEGAKRICGTAHGDLHETILRIDHQNRLFRYAIHQQPLLPLTNLVGTMKVTAENDKTRLEWTAEFEIANESVMSVIEPAIENLYAAGAQGLARVSH